MPPMNKCVLSALCFLFFSSFAWTQETFQFTTAKKKQRLTFELINNLIVIPVRVNGVELSFLLDSGVNSTLLFNNSNVNQLHFEDKTAFQVTGFGRDDSVTAYLTEGNTIQIKNIAATAESILLLEEDNFEFSKRMGAQIDGIIGYRLLEPFLVTINYSEGFLLFQSPEHRSAKKCRRCDVLDLELFQNKPYISVAVQQNDTLHIKGNALLDTGSSDALWLLEKKNDVVAIPPYFDDFLGRGINGNIYGKRGKIKELSFGKSRFSGVKVAYPDPSAFDKIRIIENRIGSVGGELLKRYKVIFDYRHKKLYLKPNRLTHAPFYYNMSGLSIQHKGMALNKIRTTNAFGVQQNGEDYGTAIEIHLNPQFRIELIPVYEIFEVRECSPAAQAGVRKGDELYRINGRKISLMKLNQINELFQKKPGHPIRMEVRRNGKILKYNFVLQPLF